MSIKFKNTYIPKGKNILLFCLKQGMKSDGIHFYAKEMQHYLSKENTLYVVGKTEFLDQLSDKRNITKLFIPSIKSPLLKWPYLFLYLPVKFRKLLSSMDEVVFTTEDLPIISLGLSKVFFRHKFKLNFVIHDLAEFFIRRYSVLKDFYRRAVLRLMAYSCDSILTISKKTKADILKLKLAENESEILFFYNNISTPSFDGLNKRLINQKYILYVAGFDYPSKNHLGFLKKIKDSNFSDLIIFAGNVEENSSHLLEINKYIDKNHLTNKVKILKNISSQDLANLYYFCEYTIFPSEYEGFGRPILESISYGKKVYANDVGVYREIKDHELVFSLDNFYQKINS